MLIVDLRDDEPVIRCDNNKCKNGQHFHLTCMELDGIRDVTQSWFCSAECANVNEYPFCYCKCDRGETIPMVGCDNANCQKGEWFHWPCVGVNSETDLPRMLLL